MSKRNNRMKNRQPPSSKPMVVSNTQLDIVICVHNRFDLLEKCLDAIPAAAGEISYNIICVDNASTEEDGFYAKRDDLIVIRNKENYGFPKGCNQGASRRKSPFILMLNSDVILEPGSIEKMVKEMNDPTIGVVGALLIFPEDTAGLNPDIRPANTVQHVGLETNIHGQWIHQFIGWSVTNPRVLAQRFVYAVTGAVLLTRRTLWNKIGGFFEGYGLGTYEDADYCLSVRDLGYNIVVVPEARGIHYVGATAEKYRIPYPMNNNRMIFMQRWQSKLQWTEFIHW